MLLKRILPGLVLAAAFMVTACSDAPFIERAARRIVLVELFSSTG